MAYDWPVRQGGAAGPKTCTTYGRDYWIAKILWDRGCNIIDYIYLFRDTSRPYDLGDFGINMSVVYPKIKADLTYTSKKQVDSNWQSKLFFLLKVFLAFFFFCNCSIRTCGSNCSRFCPSNLATNHGTVGLWQMVCFAKPFY